MALTTHSRASTYDVFLSFSGSDTRYGFTGNLYKVLTDKGINTFIDDEQLQRGEEIAPALVKAIEESAIAITVLSKDYASSSFCLDELVTILDCAEKKGMLVLPVFHNIDPSDVRHLRGSYGQALAKHEERFKQHNNDHGEKLQKWKMALCRVANLSGYHFKEGDGYEYVFIKKIVEQVSSRKVNRVALRVVGHPIGLKSRVLKVRKLLDYGSDTCVQMIGILGMGGIGKSTLARAVYNNLIAGHENFDGFCFLENVREKSNKHGLEHLQSILLMKILGGKEINLTSVEEGARLIQQRLQQKKVLLIIDDVDNVKQLEAIVGRPDWFGLGSRVIVTTRDKQILKSHGVEILYEVEGLEENDARQLLTWKAFKKEKANPSYEMVLNRVVNYASGLPLALEVIGSHLFGKSVVEWESAINQYKRNPNRQILKILKVSFDALGEEEKSVFIDIACCFKGCELTYVEHILHALYDDNMKYHIGVLVEKSLIEISWSGTVEMHDLIQDMGRRIDQQDSPKEPSNRRRLWLKKDIKQVLKDNTGTSETKILCLEFSISNKAVTLEWNGNAFRGMKKLKVLINRNVKFSEGPDYFPESLRVLEWHQYPLNHLPSNFHPKKLAICKLPDSCLTSFELGGSSKKMENLTILNFDRCELLAQIPDISHLVNLKELSFKRCENLTRVHDSVGSLPGLKILSAFGCTELMSFPRLNMTSLERLELSCCSKLEKFPEISGKMKNMRKLYLIDLSKIEFPWSFQNLIGLQYLFIKGDNVRLPSSIALMPELYTISFGNEDSDGDNSGWQDDGSGWQWVKPEKGEEIVASIASSEVDEFQAFYCLNDDFFRLSFKWLAQVSVLRLPGNNFTFLPKCIEEFHNLHTLEVSYCKRLQEIRGVPPNLTRFTATNCISMTSSSTSMFLNQELHEDGRTRYMFPGTSIPEWFDQQSRGPSTSFWFRNKLPDTVLCLLIAPLVDGIDPKVFINGKLLKSLQWDDPEDVWEFSGLDMSDIDHTHLFDLLSLDFFDNLFDNLFDLRTLDFYDNRFKVASENEWNHVEVTYAGVLDTSTIKAFGIHVFKEESSMDDIRYVDPYTKESDDDNLRLA